MRQGSGGWITRFDLIAELEAALRERVSDSRGSPFIAHCDTPHGLEEAAHEQLVECVGGSLDSFFWLLVRFPCVCTRVVAIALAKAYGGGGDHVVYKHIAESLRLGETISPRYRPASTPDLGTPVRLSV